MTTVSSNGAECTAGQNSSRQYVPPEKDEAYSDIFWASLYGTLCGFGFAEVRLIWMRSSAFLIAHAAFIGLLGRGVLSTNSSKAWLYPTFAVFGLFLALLWSTMNCLGWKNQSTWYWHAARIKFKGVNVNLPTDSWSGQELPKPCAIFIVAQLTVALFVAVYSMLLGVSLRSAGVGPFWSIALAAVSAIGVLIAAWAIHSKFYKLSGVA